MPTFQFTNNETGENFDVDFDTEPTEADFQHVQSQLDSQPVVDSGQSRAASMGSGLGRGLGSVFTGTVEGLGQLEQFAARNLNPVGWAAMAGVPGAQQVVDYASAPGKYVEELGQAGTDKLEEALPVNPLFADTMGQKASQAVGQAGGQLATLFTGAAITKAPKILQILGLGQAGLLELESGYAEADRLGITELWERDTLAGIYAAAGTGMEGIAGVGNLGFSKALTGEVMDLLKGNAIKRAAKTMAGEGLMEEPATGILQAVGSNIMAEQDPANPGFAVNGQPLPSIDPTTGEFWSDRGEEALYGTIGGGVFAGAQFAMTQPKVDQARRLHQKASLAETLLEDKPEPTAEDVAELQEIRENKMVLGEFISEAEKKLAVPPNIPETPTADATAVLAQNIDVPEVSATAEALASVIGDTEAETLPVTPEGVTTGVTPFIAPEDEVIAEELPIQQDVIPAPQEAIPAVLGEIPATGAIPTQNAPQSLQEGKEQVVANARAVVDSQKSILPSAADAWVGTRQEMLADPVIRQTFIQNERTIDPDLSEQEASVMFDQYMSNPLMDGVTFAGRTYIVADGVEVTEKDQTFDGAIKRLLRHEDTHIAIDTVTQTNPKRKKEWEGLKKRVAPEKLDSLAKRRYPKLSNWRQSSEAFNDLAHEYFAEQMEWDEAGQTVDDRDLLQQFIAYMKKVLARVTGREVSLEEIREFVFAGRVARAREMQAQTRSSRASLQEGVPPMPAGEPAFTDWIPIVDKARAMELAWRPFAVAWQEENPQGTTEQLNAAWAAEIADPESPAISQGQTEAFMEARQSKEGPAVYSPEPSQTAPETSQARFSLKPQDPIVRLKEINEAFSYQTQAGQQEGLDPNKATRDKRIFTSDGTIVDFSRGGMTNAQQDSLAGEALDILVGMSKDGKSKDFGRALMAYLGRTSPDIYGLRLEPLIQTTLLDRFDFAVQERASMGIDGAEVQRVREQGKSQAAAIMQRAASSIFEPLRDIEEKGRQLNEKTMKEEGVDPVKLDAEIKAEVKAAQTELAKDISTPEIKASILEGAQNEADELYELGLSGLDPKFSAMIRERDERVARLGRLIKMEAMLSGGPKGAKASLAALPDNMTLEEVRAMIAQEKAEIEKLESTIEAASKKEKRKAREDKTKETEDNATFSAWVNGGESAGIDLFDDLMQKYIDPNGFDRVQFTTLLINSFKQADPNFIMGVAYRVGAYIDGAATEEGAEVDAAKAPNYDARVKRLVATEIAKSSTPEVIQIKRDPFTELTKQRLKGEISAENFQKEAIALGIEQETAFSLLQKVDQDRARIGDAQAQRELNAQAKKDMAAFRRGLEKAEREAQAKINTLAQQFTDTPNLSKAQATSDLKALANSFLGREGPPISSEDFLTRAEALNLTPATAQNLLRLLQESRRRDSAVRYAKAVQKAQEARKRAIESAVKKLGKTGQGNATKLRQRSTFVNSVLGLLEGGIMDSTTIQQAFAQAYELHGLTPEVLKNLGEQLQQIQAMKEGIPKETLLLQFNSTLNAVAPTASFGNYSYTALMGYILGGVTTLAMQTTGLNRFLNPLAGTVETLFSLPGTTTQKIGRTINPMNLIKVYMDGLAETWSNVPQTLAGASGLKSSTGFGVGMQPSNLAAVKPREMSMAHVPWGEISKYRFDTPKLLKAMGLDKAVQATRFSAWMASRSFQAIRGAEGWVGGTDKNVQFKRVAVEALMKQGKTFDEAWNMVQEALGPKNAEIWQKAGEQADKEISEGLVSKFSKKQRQTELAQDVIDEQWNLDLKNRYREQSALAGYKQDPISPLGAWMYSQLSSVFNNEKSLMSNLKFSFLFARFFSNAIESAYFRTPIAGLMALGIKEPSGPLSDRQQRIVQIFGSMDNYRDVRLGRAASGTAILGSLGAMMVYSLLNWDPDDDEAPGPIWMTGDPIGEFGRKAIMESNSWWRPNTLYLFGKPVVNFVNASPEYAMAGAFAGNVGDRFMFDKLLNMKKDPSSDEWVRSDFQSYVAPFRDTVLAPWSRSTYSQWFGAAEALFDGDGKKFAKLFANPFVGSAAALTIGAIPSVKTLEKVERMQYQPKAPKDIPQAFASSVPFANTLGLDMGQPMVTPFGEETSGYPFLSILVNPQEVTETSRKAANLLAQLGITKLGVKERYLGDGTSEVFHEGKRYLLSQEQRGRVLRQIGQTFASMININADKLRKLEKTKGKDAASDEINSYAKKAKSKVLFGLIPARK